MNRTHLEHLIVALVIQGFFIGGFNLLGLQDGSWFGAAFVTALFIGREHAQREYKIGDPSKLKGYEALDIWRWSLDAKLDLLVPVLAVFIVAVLLNI
ncbi:hypothetical protein PAEH1_01560 [Paenalcaligenes hominis]|uniref:Uncharacterized protein n=1 Tax=Paenalcaligenes hominis TaxID=643674 RepID=A0A1U9JXT6_9BURK|nr:hypothetical protein [Paenalcaligenes hominis]AQS50566.1 hypothetical protein PAEH1_01560 [Paenalcaligenes hominis]